MRIDEDAAQSDLFGGARPSPAVGTPELVALASRLPPRLRLGTSSWAFPGWRGLVYAQTHRERELAREGLAAYARMPLLRAVGVDRGFYAPIPRAELRRYAEVVPPDFRFVLKAHASLTIPPDAPRPKFLEGVQSRFLDVAHARDAVIGPACEQWGTKLGIVLFQFSPLAASPWAARMLRAGAMRELLVALYRFLRDLPRGPTYAIEWRDPQLLVPEYAKLLEATGAIHCASVHPRMPHPVEQLRLAPGPPSAPRFVRWVLQAPHTYESARQRYAPFDRLVEPDAAMRAQIAALSAEALVQGRDVTVIANNKAEGSAPLTLHELARAVAERLEDA